MDPNGDPNLPDRLADDLAALYRAEVRVPTEVDRLVASGARAHFARRRRWVRWASAGAAVAAAVVVSVLLLRPDEDRHIAQTAAATVTAGDANADGRVDIRDALSLARRIEGGSAQPTPRADINRDNVIDHKDVDAIAMMAVRLDAFDAAEVVQ